MVRGEGFDPTASGFKGPRQLPAEPRVEPPEGVEPSPLAYQASARPSCCGGKSGATGSRTLTPRVQAECTPVVL
jgi:hypothetical protein